MNPDINILFEKGAQLDDLHYWMEVAAKDDQAFQDFWAIANDKEVKNNWRALWVIDHAIQRNTQRLDEVLKQLYSLMLETDNHSLLRMGIKLICQRPILANDQSGELLNKCEDILLNTKMPIATRANSLQYIFEFCKIEPDLINELEVLMDHLAENETSGGMTARIRNIRKACTKLKA